MMASTSSSPGTRTPTLKFKQSIHPSLSRKTSVIVPATGLRDRTLTLTPFSPAYDETTPLLSNRHHGYDSDDSDDETSSRRRRLTRKCGAYWDFLKSSKARNILKCSIAYFVGSLATFVAPISQLLGHYDGKHMVATLCVYFHPARSAGSMHQATIYAMIAFLYSTFVSVASMGLTVLFEVWDLVELGHALVLLIFCVGGLGLIGYVKHMKSHPTVSVACSLAAISIITILTKEGSIQRAQFSLGKTTQVSMILFMSIIISNILAFILWPSSAITDLRKMMKESLNTFSVALSGIARSFINGTNEEDIQKLTAGHASVYSSLLKHLKEAKYEHYVRGTEQEYEVDVRLVESLQRLSQNIGGLRSAALTQYTLLCQASGATPRPSTAGSQNMIMKDRGQPNTVNIETFLFTPPERETRLYMPIVPEADSEPPSPDENTAPSGRETTIDNFTFAPLAVFEIFIYHLGPPMKSLAIHLNLMLQDLPFGPGNASQRIVINPNFETNLQKALNDFESKREEALNALYRSEEITRSRSVDLNADVEEEAASCNYFAYNLAHFAEEMRTFLQILHDLERIQATQPRTWEWLKFWRSSGKKTHSRDPEESRPVFEAPDLRLKRTRTIPNVAPESKIPRSYKLWKALGILRKDEVKFSIKVGIGAALFALPAFIPSTKPTFSLWRGEWGLVSYMIIMSMTLGQTNNSGLYRVLGTIIGALLALFAWIAFPENPYALSIFGWLVSLPCFWIILNWKQATFGRFILLTYNLSALYAYSLSVADDDDDDDEGGVNPIITEIVLHRFVAVIAGVLWGIFINRVIWPISARKQLRKGLSRLWLRMSLIWAHDPLNVLVGENNLKHRSITDVISLQKALVGLFTLAAAAPHEFRLKGAFPVKEYDNILKQSQSILDALHGLSVMIAQDPRANKREADIIACTQEERDNLCARISHRFYLLGSAMRITFPLPENLPNTVRARDRLLARLFDYRKTVKGSEGDADEDFALIYAYALVTGRISEGLDELTRTFRVLYGVLEDEELEI